MFKSFFKGATAPYAWGMLTLLTLAISFEAWLTRQFNDWYKVFYDALENRNYEAWIDSFWFRGDSFIWFDITSWGFTPLAILAILLFTYISFLGSVFQLRWREALTLHYLPLWKKAEAKIEGSSQRIQEDTRKFSWMLWVLGRGFVKSIMLLVFFLPLLWTISEGLGIPGYLVWVALIVSVGGLAVTAFLGRKLPRLEYSNQRVEAEFRKSLVHCEDNRKAHGMDILKDQFEAIRFNYMRLYTNYKIYWTWSNTYFQIGVVLPYFIMAPQYFAAVITLGTLVQIANAFDKVHESFSFFLDNWMTVVELQSVHIRLTEFESEIYRR